MKTDPDVAVSRKALADLYRKARQDDPRIARLLYRRVKAAYAQYRDFILRRVSR